MSFLIALLLAVLPANAQEEAAPKDSAPNEQTTSQQDTGASVAVQTGNNEQGTGGTTPKPESGEDTSQLVIATWVLAGVTGLLFAAGCGQFELARRIAQREMRAYICYRGSRYEMAEGNERIVLIVATIRNAGRTPSHETSAGAGAYFVRIPLEQARFDNPALEVFGAIGPDSDFSITIPFDVMNTEQWREEWTDYFAGNARLYLRGIAEYRDVFGKRRETEFCEEIRWVSGQEPFHVLTPGHNDVT